MIFTRNFANCFVFALTAALLFPACGIKTRTQLKNEGYTGGNTVNAAEPKAVGNQSYVIDELKSEISRLSGRIEILERSARDQQGGEASKKIEQRLLEVEKTQLQILEAIKRLEARSRTSKVIFEEGKRFLQQGRLKEAAVNFSLYLKKSPKGKNAGEALFLRAESYYRANQFAQAAKDYNDLYTRFKRSKFIPQALYKLGLSFESLGEKSAARTYYEELVSNYPKSSYARRAKGKLNYNKKKPATKPR